MYSGEMNSSLNRTLEGTLMPKMTERLLAEKMQRVTLCSPTERHTKTISTTKPKGLQNG